MPSYAKMKTQLASKAMGVANSTPMMAKTPAPKAKAPTPMATMPARSSKPAPITKQVDQQRQALSKIYNTQQTFGVPGAK